MKYTTAKCITAAILFAGLFLTFGCGDKTADAGKLTMEGHRALENGELNQAVNLFKKALLEKPSDRDLLYYLGVSFKRLDLPDSAYSYFRRAKILYVHDREINREIIDMAPMYGDYDDAINAIAVMVLIGDNEKMYWPRLAELHYRNQDMYMAAKYCRLIIADDPESKDYYLYLSRSLSQLGKIGESNDVLFDALDKFGPSSEAYANIAVNYISMNNAPKAEEFFRKSLAVNPSSVPTWINLANVLTEQNDRTKKEEALGIYRQYYEQTPPAYKLDSIIPALETELGR